MSDDLSLAMRVQNAVRALPFTRAEIILCSYAALYALIGWAVAAFWGDPEKFNPFLYGETSELSALIFFLGYLVYRLLRLYYIFIFVRPKKLAAHLKQDFLDGPLNMQRYVRAFPVFFGFMLLFSVFTSLKSMIPDITTYSWDPFWADVDRTLHGGIDPWRILHPLLGYPPVTEAVNWVYTYWMFVKYFVLYAMLLSIKKPFLRMQFFYAYALSWTINGSLLAILWASGGPCFYEPLTGVDRFGELMSYLKSVSPEDPIPAIQTQAMLWEKYTKDIIDFGSGISAMPSLHVVAAFLFMMVGLHSHTIWKIAGVLFYISIVVGSIHLGWHYAVDGYIATLTTYLFWRFSGWFLRRHGGAPYTQSQDEQKA